MARPGFEFAPTSPMQIIPVIDIKDGIAVHAVQGRRDSYRPLVTRYTDSTDPATLVGALCAALPIAAIYIADLDAIMQSRPHTALITRIASAHPGLRVLVDAGFSAAHSPASCAMQDNVDIVLGSEALSTLDELETLLAALPADRAFLSLDRKGAERLGCRDIFDTPSSWPARVIHMNLSRVGSDGGPDFAGLAELRTRAGPERRLFAAGGVRDVDDLARLAAEGIAGVLIGSALHDGRLDAACLATYHEQAAR